MKLSPQNWVVSPPRNNQGRNSFFVQKTNSHVSSKVNWVPDKVQKRPRTAWIFTPWMDGRRSTMPNPYDPWEWYICLRLVTIYGTCRYAPEIEDKRWLYVKRSCIFQTVILGSHVSFLGCYNHTWILRVNKKS